MKIYAVVMGRGEYENYREDRKYFFDKVKAQEFMVEYDNNAKRDNLEIKKCKECKYRELTNNNFLLITDFPDCYLNAEDSKYFCNCKNQNWNDEEEMTTLEEIEVI